MAFNLSAILNFSSKGIKSGLTAANKQLTNFQNNLGQASAKVKAMGPGVRNVGVIGTGMAAGMGVAIKSFMDFQRQMDSVKAKMQPTKQEYLKMSDLAKEMGAQTIYTAKQAAEGFEYLALAGFNATDAMGVLPTLLYTAGAGALELGRASDIITDSMSAMAPVMKGFGDKTKQATALSDMMALAQAKTNTNIEQLGEAIKYGGGAMANMQIPLHEIIGSMGALADAGIKGSSGGTSLVNMMSKLSAPSTKATKMLEEMGISMEDIKYRASDGTMKLKSMDKVMQVFSKAIERNPDMLNKNGVAMEIFGKRGSKAFFALQNKGAPALAKLFNQLKDSKGASKTMYETMTDNIYGAWESFKSATGGITLNMGAMLSGIFDVKGILQAVTKPLSTFAMALGNAMKPAKEWSPMAKQMMATPLGQFALGVASGFKSIKNTLMGLIATAKSWVKQGKESGINFKQIAEWVTKAAVALAIIGPPLLAAGAALFLLTPIFTAVVSGASAFATVLGLLVSPVALVAAGVGALGYAFYKLMGGWQGIKQAATSFASGFMETWTPIWDLLKKDIIPIFTDVKQTFLDAFGVFSNASTDAGTTFTSFGKTIGTVAGFIVTALKPVIQTIGFFAKGIASIGGLGVAAFKGVKGWLSDEKEKDPFAIAKERIAKRRSEMGLGKVAAGTTGTPTATNVIPFPKTPTTRAAQEANTAQIGRTRAQATNNIINIPNQQAVEPKVEVVIQNTVDENGINTMVKKAERHNQNKQGNQMSGVVSDRSSQPKYAVGG